MRYLVIIMMFWVSYLPAQREISGKVIDAHSKEAIFAANIIVKGTTRGTMANMDGTFELELLEGDTTLVFSMIGYVDKEVKVPKEDSILIELEEDVIDVASLTGCGYGPGFQRLSLGFDFENGAVGAEWRQLFGVLGTFHTYDLKLYKGYRNQYFEVGYELPNLLPEFSFISMIPEVYYRNIQLKEYTKSQYDVGLEFDLDYFDLTTSLLVDQKNKGWQVKAEKSVGKGRVKFNLEAFLGRIDDEWQYNGSVRYHIWRAGAYVKGEYTSIGEYQGLFIKLGKYL